MRQSAENLAKIVGRISQGRIVQMGISRRSLGRCMPEESADLVQGFATGNQMRCECVPNPHGRDVLNQFLALALFSFLSGQAGRLQYLNPGTAQRHPGAAVCAGKFLWDRKKPYGVITTKNTLSAMLATVFIDRLRGARIGFCARPDCKKEFRVVSNHERRYCKPYCAHLESLRRLRARRKRRRNKNLAMNRR
jgi:hypothetical protein